METPFPIGTNLFRFVFENGQCILYVGAFVDVADEQCVIQFKGKRYELGKANQVATDLYAAMLKGTAAVLNMHMEDRDMSNELTASMCMAICRAATNYIEKIRPGWKRQLEETDREE